MDEAEHFPCFGFDFSCQLECFAVGLGTSLAVQLLRKAQSRAGQRHLFLPHELLYPLDDIDIAHGVVAPVGMIAFRIQLWELSLPLAQNMQGKPGNLGNFADAVAPVGIERHVNKCTHGNANRAQGGAVAALIVPCLRAAIKVSTGVHLPRRLQHTERNPRAWTRKDGCGVHLAGNWRDD